MWQILQSSTELNLLYCHRVFSLQLSLGRFQFEQGNEGYLHKCVTITELPVDEAIWSCYKAIFIVQRSKSESLKGCIIAPEKCSGLTGIHLVISVIHEDKLNGFTSASIIAILLISACGIGI